MVIIIFFEGYLVWYVDTGQGTAQELDSLAEFPPGDSLAHYMLSINTSTDSPKKKTVPRCLKSGYPELNCHRLKSPLLISFCYIKVSGAIMTRIIPPSLVLDREMRSMWNTGVVNGGVYATIKMLYGSLLFC